MFPKFCYNVGVAVIQNYEVCSLAGFMGLLMSHAEAYLTGG